MSGQQDKTRISLAGFTTGTPLSCGALSNHISSIWDILGLLSTIHGVYGKFIFFIPWKSEMQGRCRLGISCRNNSWSRYGSCLLLIIATGPSHRCGIRGALYLVITLHTRFYEGPHSHARLKPDATCWVVFHLTPTEIVADNTHLLKKECRLIG